MQHQSLDRALKILLTFETQNKEVGIVELSNLLGLHKSTVSRIMKVLAAYDFLEQNPQTKKFSLGQTNIRLAISLKQSLRSNMVQIAKPYVDDLRDRFGETTVLETFVGRNWVMVYVAEGPGRIRLSAEVGERMPIHVAAGSKAFLAFSSPELRASLLKGNLKRYTKNTIISPKKLNRHFEIIRRQGFALDKGELDEEIYAIAVPIFGYQDKPVATLAIAGQPKRIMQANNSLTISALKEAAKEVSNRFGYKEEQERHT
jgi:IclR family KDG regulon transcriptional repressor